MADHPGSQTQPAQGGSGEQGWGSPMPAEYGSLHEHPPARGNGGTGSPRERPVDPRADGRVAARPQKPAAPRQGWADRLRKAVSKAPSTGKRSSQPAPVRQPSWDDWDLNGRRSPPATSGSGRAGAAPSGPAPGATGQAGGRGRADSPERAGSAGGSGSARASGSGGRPGSAVGAGTGRIATASGRATAAPDPGVPSVPRSGARRSAVARSSGAAGVAGAPTGFLRGLKRSVTKPARPSKKSRGLAPARGEPTVGGLPGAGPAGGAGAVGAGAVGAGAVGSAGAVGGAGAVRGAGGVAPADVLGDALLDVYSVAKVSIVFYLILLVIFVIASIFLWLVADAFGAVDSIQRSIRSLFDVKSYVLHPGTIALYTSAAGAVLAVAGTIANVLAAVIYNLISEVIGGIRLGVSPAAEDEEV